MWVVIVMRRISFVKSAIGLSSRKSHRRRIYVAFATLFTPKKPLSVDAFIASLDDIESELNVYVGDLFLTHGRLNWLVLPYADI